MKVKEGFTEKVVSQMGLEGRMDGVYSRKCPNVQRGPEQTGASRAHRSLTKQWEGGYQTLGMNQVEAKRISWKKNTLCFILSASGAIILR